MQLDKFHRGLAGGGVTKNNALGLNSEFLQSIRQQNNDPVLTSTPQTMPPTARSWRVMVVEDTPASQKLFERILEPAGYEFILHERD